MATSDETHSTALGYVFWLFGLIGLTGLHRLYYGRQVTGVIWLLTLGLLLIGWIVDLFLMPDLSRDANAKYCPGRIDYSVAWVLLLLLGALGIHRFFMGKWITGLIWLLTGGLVGLGVIYDWLTLNRQIDELHRQPVPA
jgi:TM2 domain-containing membrane protein YozV